MLKRLGGRLKKIDQLHLIIGALSIAFIALVYSWKIGSLTAGMSPAEASTLANSKSLHALYQHPLNAPHNFLLYLILKSGHKELWLLRGVSAAWALVFAISFYRIARSWFGAFTGWLSALIFATTPLVILAAHSVSADIMILAPVLLAASYFWLSRADSPPKWGTWLLAALSALSVYSPGGIWFIIAGVIATRKTVREFISELGAWTWLAIVVFLVLLLPLGLGLAHSPRQILDWAALPQSLHAVSLLRSVGWAFLALFWRSAYHTSLQIGREPVIHLTQAILATLGLFAMWQKVRLKTSGVITLVILSAVAAGLSNIYSLSLIAVAALSVLVATGLRYLHIEWQAVFPKNPIARGFALIIILTTVGFSIFYGVRYSLVAWPHSLATKQSYVLK